MSETTSLHIEQPVGAIHIEDNFVIPLQKSVPISKVSKIEHLVLNNLHVEQATLKRILMRCPRLRILKSINILVQESDSNVPEVQVFHIDTIGVQDTDIDQVTASTILAPFLSPHLTITPITLEIFQTGSEMFKIISAIHYITSSARSIKHLLVPAFNYAEHFDFPRPSVEVGCYNPSSYVLWLTSSKSHRLKKQVWGAEG
ncbi:hypothetical protein BGZ49_007420 [Haplosporangium sp. Z 27]|nr:hypothetical protein BGZ49_007420 [Haplosporangium sp. Z 27]